MHKTVPSNKSTYMYITQCLVAKEHTCT